jgi:predicted kinase
MGIIRLQCAPKTLIVPVAVPGSGKSTLLGQVLPHSGFRHGPDDVRRALYGSVEEQGHGGKVHDAARACLECRLAVGLPAAYDATNVTPSARKLITDLGRRYGYRTLGLVSNVPTSVALARNSLRVVGRVPEHVINRMAKQVQSAPVTLDEDFDSLAWFGPRDHTLIIDWT